ncbi:hypothetical protein SDC9_62071 [bioreactor metagenome]|uniref:Uncharacterized protein n=1 Tax=bioreactor metagenome TaxID=1076179 RepID=A0A644XHL4_9ZZZZ
MNADQRFFLWRKRNKIQFDFGYQGQSAFGPCKNFTEIEFLSPGKWLSLHKQVDGVTGVSPFDSRVRKFLHNAELIVIIR